MDVTCSDPFVGSEKEGKNNFSCEKIFMQKMTLPAIHKGLYNMTVNVLGFRLLPLFSFFYCFISEQFCSTHGSIFNQQNESFTVHSMEYKIKGM